MITAGPATSGGGRLIWPVVMEAHDEVLKNHCESLYWSLLRSP
jgi:hypothetical protein